MPRRFNPEELALRGQLRTLNHGYQTGKIAEVAVYFNNTCSVQHTCYNYKQNT